MILGPAGTGKTTTLIRRLGQKLDVQFLDDDERRIVKEVGISQHLSHENSWLMFTPTELLRQYLKEAFAREGVPAPDRNIRTWDEHRRELCRRNFDILKTTTGAGLFIFQAHLLAFKIRLCISLSIGLIVSMNGNAMRTCRIWLRPAMS